jgi:hypothetical protein
MKKRSDVKHPKAAAAMTAYELLRASAQASPLKKKTQAEINQMIQEIKHRNADRFGIA